MRVTMESKPPLFYKSAKESWLSGEVQRGERAIACALLALLILLKFFFVFRYAFDSDEPQHLHVVWGWANGLVQYRDFFDNHAPLFHLLCAPLLKLIGQGPETLFAMRLAMIPLCIMALWCTYAIGRELFSVRCGLWAAVCVGLWPQFFFWSIEFRPDTLWTVLLLLAVTVLVRAGLSAARSFSVGFLLGAAMGVSVKTTFLLASLGLGALALVAAPASFYLPRYDCKRLGKYGVAFLAGFFVVPSLVFFSFYRWDALGCLFSQTIQHNSISGLGLWDNLYEQILIFSLSLLPLWFIARSMARHTRHEGLLARRLIVLFICFLYFSLLIAFCPLMELEHFLPFFPLVFIFLAPLLCNPLPLRIFAQVRQHMSRCLSMWVIPALVALLEVGAILAFNPGELLNDSIMVKKNLISDVLRLTGTDDPVADLKGETIFRQRSSYYVFEKITRVRLKRGLMTDDIPERLIATRTCVATPDNEHFPPRARDFLNENYIPVGSLRVAGKLLNPLSDAAQPFSFSIRIPSQYVIVSQNGFTAGRLDGKHYDSGACFLEAGKHEFLPSTPSVRYAFFWAKAHERGYSPFDFWDTTQ